RGKASRKALTAMTRQLTTLIGAGLPLRRSLSILEEQCEDSNLRDALGGIGEDIEAGSNFSEALAKYPRIFNKLFINMVKAGELSGALEEVLDRLSIFAEKAAGVRAKVRSAMMYPAFVVLFSAILVSLILIFIVPKFEAIYTGFGAKLPAMTQLLVVASGILMHHAPAVILGFVAFMILLWRVNKTEKGKYCTDYLLLKLPIFGAIIQKGCIAKFSRTFATLLQTGVPILQSLVVVKDTAGNEVVARAMIRVHASIREGDTISEPLRECWVFPPLVIHMIAIGEETGAIDTLLAKVAEAYEREVDAAVDGLTALIEPLIIIILGVIIGFIVIALYMPIFKLVEAVK
ncbi:MAG TPA: type II secretion system F family protein, partial [bacterium]|nr:type II secretion system F family protein [bacterium]